jgi:hypothetical protein
MRSKICVLMRPMLVLGMTTLCLQAQTRFAIVNMNGALIGTRDGQKRKGCGAHRKRSRNLARAHSVLREFLRKQRPN